MAAVNAGRQRPQSVPAPAKTKFVHGTYPPSPSIQPTNRIKPMTGQTQYGKPKPPASPFGDTGMSGMS